MAIGEVHLALLLSGPRHGYDIKRAHDAWFPAERPLAFGQVYATLGRLVRDGHAEVVGTHSEGGPERTVYAITGSGRERLLTWLDEPAPPAGTTGEEIIRKTVVALHSTTSGADAERVLSAQRAAHLRRMRQLQRRSTEQPGGDVDLAVRLADRHALLHLDADLRWLEEAAEALRAQPPAASTTSTTTTTTPTTTPDDQEPQP
ncbi:PadR family transcriptional regulator [Quadrisphaera sp. INWT6]|uniref:PadR family transcriptional regulator n=1 Tax=Quadrisphaera sp. INWT6 TaxID=2596917 RepID=UPI001891FE14|nr:PadR family transcriptional regulator [Quadrisphaera sp. INWT6]MBF5082517.1 PadR family transcriptional regulator [Quadrisphaera sp. INWT6]